MIYGLKYFGEFKSLLNSFFRVEIEERSFTGESTEMVMAENPLQLDYPGDEYNVYRPVFGSQLIVSVISGTNFQYINLHTADARQYRVTVYKDEVLLWRGWILPDLFNEPYVAPPYVVQITARCGLGELENVQVPETVMSYVDGDTPTLKSFVNLYSIVIYALKYLNLGLNLHEAINIYNAERTTPPINTDTTLTDTYIDLSQYAEFNLYDLLSDVMKSFTARLYQQDGAWWMVRIKELNQTLRYRILDVDGGSTIGFDDTKLTTFLIGKPHNNHIVNNAPELRINPAWKEFTLRSIKEKRPSILKNYDFKELQYIEAGYAGTRRNEYRYEAIPADWQRFGEIAMSGTGLRIQKNTNNNWTKYIYQEVDIEATTTQALRIRINASPIVDRNRRGIWPSGSGAKTSFAFGLNNKQGMTVKYLHYDDYGFATWENGSNVIVIPDAETIGYQQDNVKTYEVIVRGIPLSGQLSFALFGAQQTSLFVKSVEIEIIEIINPWETVDRKIILREYEDNPESLIVINQFNSYIPSPVEVYGGDLPDVPNASLIWKYGYKDPIKKRTRIWNNYGETEELPLLQHLANDYRKMYSIPQWVLSVPIISNNIKFDSSIVDYQVIGKKYQCVSASFNLRDGICEGVYAEVGAWEGTEWILETGFWNSSGIWIDSETWKDDDSE